MYKVIFGIGLGFVGFSLESNLPGFTFFTLWGVIIGIVVGAFLDARKKEAAEKAFVKRLTENTHKIEDSQFFADIKRVINSRNENSYKSSAESNCKYNYKPKGDIHYVAYSSLNIGNTAISGRGPSIIYADLGYRDITDEDCNALGIALVKHCGYVQKTFGSTDFRHLVADPKVWVPRIQRCIDTVYARKAEEFRKTHKSIY